MQKTAAREKDPGKDATDKVIGAAIASLGLGLIGLWIFPSDEFSLAPLGAILAAVLRGPDSLAYVLYFSQFLAYGFVFGIAWSRGKLLLGVIAVLAVHAILWALAFLVLLQFGRM